MGCYRRGMLRGILRRQTIRGRFRVRCVRSAVVSLGFLGPVVV